MGFRERESGTNLLMFRLLAWGSERSYRVDMNCRGRVATNEGSMLGTFAPGPTPRTLHAELSVEDGQTSCLLFVDGELALRDVEVLQGVQSSKHLEWGIWTRHDPMVHTPAARMTLTALHLRGVTYAPSEVDLDARQVAKWIAGYSASEADEHTTITVDRRNAERLLDSGQRKPVKRWLAEGSNEATDLFRSAVRRDSRWVSLAQDAMGHTFPGAYAEAWAMALPSDPNDPEWLRVDTSVLENSPIETGEQARVTLAYSRALELGGQPEHANRQALRCALSGLDHPAVAQCWSRVATDASRRGDQALMQRACTQLIELDKRHVAWVPSRDLEICTPLPPATQSQQ